jgi:short-subunit dehydrogenase
MAASSTSSARARPTALVTGASAGIGRAIAAALTRRGYHVFGTMRAPERLAAGERLPGVTYLALDLTDRESVRRCAAATPPLDVLVSNAGVSQVGPLELAPAESVERLFATNVLGPVELIRLCLPGMRGRERPAVIVIGSLAAEFPIPFQAVYAATKLALRGIVLALRTELRPAGVRVALVEPGDVRTDIQDRLERLDAAGSGYGPRVEEMSARARGAVAAGMAPERVAEKVCAVLAKRRPPPIQGVGAEGSALAIAGRMMPRKLAERLVARRYGL